MQTRLSKFLSIAPALLAIIIDYFGWGLVYPLAIAIINDPHNHLVSASTTLDMREFYLSLSFFLYPICMLFGSSSLGDLSDIYGRKKVLFLCTIGIGISFLCMGFGLVVSSLTLFLIGRAVSGFMAGTVPIAQASVVDVSSPEDKPFNLALLSITFSVGLILGPLFSSIFSDKALVSWFGVATPLFFSALLAFITAAWIRAKFKPIERKHFAKTFSIFRPLTLFKEALQNRELRPLIVVLFLFQLGVSLYIQTILIFLNTTLHYTSVGLGLFWVVMGFGFIIGLMLLKRLIRTSISAKRLIFYSLIAQAIAIVLSSLFITEIPLWILGFLFAILNPASYALLLALFSNIAPQESQGWVMGIWSAIVALAFVAGALCNNLIPHFGMDLVIFLGGIILAFSGLIFYKVAKKTSFS
jgi:DHA1 family tetracycline resistance protein-like MFS transporter